MTLYEIQKASHAVGNEAARWEKWETCGRHNPHNLLRSSDTRHYYCAVCGTIWEPNGTCVNQPTSPKSSATNAA
jgi:hypothetical protein